MAFYARTFIFNDVPSEFHNLYLGELGGSGEATTATSSDVSLLTQKLYRRPVPLFYGAEQTPVLQFSLSMYSPNEITAVDFSEISTWLFGQNNYRKLRICQNDMQEVYFNCFLTAPQITRIGNIIQAITCTVICDAPWGWKEPKSITYNYSPNQYSIYADILINNESANGFYTYPTSLIITANVFGETVTIRNVTDNNRDFIYGEINNVPATYLLPNEVLTIDNDLQTISSSLVTYPLENFNKNFLRFVQGTNNLVITGGIQELSLTYPVAVKIGG
jgi:hypothetical protein